jgi:putative oxidoreductase
MNYKIHVFLRIAIAIILLQTLRFKLTAHPDSVFIFTMAGLEPHGRIVIGILELIFAILLLFPKTTWIGSLGTLGIISGAIFLHLTKIGLEVNGDNGLLFCTAVFVFLGSLHLFWNERKKVVFLWKTFLKKQR